VVEPSCYSICGIDDPAFVRSIRINIRWCSFGHHNCNEDACEAVNSPENTQDASTHTNIPKNPKMATSASPIHEMPSAEQATRLAGSAEMRLGVLDTRVPQESTARRTWRIRNFHCPRVPISYRIMAHAHEQWERADSSVLVKKQKRQDSVRKKSGWCIYRTHFPTFMYKQKCRRQSHFSISDPS